MKVSEGPVTAAQTKLHSVYITVNTPHINVNTSRIYRRQKHVIHSYQKVNYLILSFQ